MNLNNPLVVRLVWTLMIVFSCVFWYFAFQGFEYTIDLIFEFMNN